MKSLRDIAGNAWSGRKAGHHILDFTESAIILRQRQPDGSIRESGRAVLDAPDFSQQIDALRIAALVQDPARTPVTIWLPESQILERKYLLSSGSRGPATSEAVRRLQMETEYTADELAVDIALGKAGEYSVVLATLCQTMREAIDYAKRWGFVPGTVSTGVAQEPFGASGATFTLPVSRAYSTGRKFAQVAAVSTIILGGGLAGLKIYEVSKPLLKAITIKHVPGHLPLPAAEVETGIKVARSSTPVARLATLQYLPIRRIPGATSYSSNTINHDRPGSFIDGVSPVMLSPPADDVAMKIGAEPDGPSHTRPGRLPSAKTEAARINLAKIRDAIDRIRLESQSLAEAAKPERRPKFQRAQQPDAVAVTTQPSSATPMQASLVANVATQRPRRRAGVNTSPTTSSVSASLIPLERAEATEPRPTETQHAAIDPAVVSVPEPRPQTSPVRAIQPEQQPDTTTVAAQKENVVVPAPLDATSLTAPEIVASTPDPEERLAALASPEPLRRPSKLRAAEPQLPKKAKAITTGRSPASVGNAASEHGLELDQTNLIGVIEARNGRRALVRLPDGDFRKVARGDDVNGWRVNSIERAAMRLTRKGQNRTLLLVSR